MQENLILFQMSYFVGRYEVLTQIDKYSLYIQLVAISLNILVSNSKIFWRMIGRKTKSSFIVLYDLRVD
jgi:hypothetical protein